MRMCGCDHHHDSWHVTENAMTCVFFFFLPAPWIVCPVLGAIIQKWHILQNTHSRQHTHSIQWNKAKRPTKNGMRINIKLVSIFTCTYSVSWNYFFIASNSIYTHRHQWTPNGGSSCHCVFIVCAPSAPLIILIFNFFFLVNRISIPFMIWSKFVRYAFCFSLRILEQFYQILTLHMRFFFLVKSFCVILFIVCHFDSSIINHARKWIIISRTNNKNEKKKKETKIKRKRLVCCFIS